MTAMDDKGPRASNRPPTREDGGLPLAAFALTGLAAILFVAGLVTRGAAFERLALAPHDVRLMPLATFGLVAFGLAHFIWSLPLFAIFAALVEERIGTVRLLIFYFFTSLAIAVCLHLIGWSDPLTPAVGGLSLMAAAFAGAHVALNRTDTESSRSLIGVRAERFGLIALVAAVLLAPFFLEERGFTWAVAVMHAVAAGAGAGIGLLTVQLAVADPQATRQRQREVQTKLAQEIRRDEARRRRAASVSAVHDDARQKLAMSVLDSIEAGDARSAYDRFHALALESKGAVLDHENHWRLAELLVRNRLGDPAIEVLKSYLRHFPHGVMSIEAQFELGLIYAGRGSMRQQAIDYLMTALDYSATDPEGTGVGAPVPLSPADKRRARLALAELGVMAPAPGDLLAAADPGGPPEPEPSHVDLQRLFGDSGDGSPYSVPTPTPAPAQSFEPKVEREYTPLPIDSSDIFEQAEQAEQKEELPMQSDDKSAKEDPRESSDYRQRSFESPPDFQQMQRDEDAKRKKPQREVKQAEDLPPLSIESSTGGLSSGPPQQEKLSEPARAQEPEPMKVAPRGDVPEEKTELPQVAPQPPVRDEETGNLELPLNVGADPEAATVLNVASLGGQRTQGPVPVTSIFFPQSKREETAAWRQHYARDRTPRYRPEFRYSLILAPGAPVHLEGILEVLEDHLQLSAPQVLHSLQRHHGLLAADLSRNEAAGLGMRFARHGQEVMLVEHEERIRFGANPPDVYRAVLADKWLQLSTADRALRRPWDELIAMSAGVVRGAEGEPARSVMNLYFARPAYQVRIWMNSLAPVAFPGSEFMDDAAAFRALAGEFARRAPHAIRSESLTQWVETGASQPMEFANLIEFDNYSMWYVMAHFARATLFTTEAEACETVLAESTVTESTA